jgi:hypothetical protein
MPLPPSLGFTRTPRSWSCAGRENNVVREWLFGALQEFRVGLETGGTASRELPHACMWIRKDASRIRVSQGESPWQVVAPVCGGAAAYLPCS